MAEFTIIGGNVSGLSAALHLHEQGHDVHVYEEKIWNKPCGGAISVEFFQYLKKKWNVELEEAHKGRYMIIGLPTGKHVRIESPFVTTTRKELQEKLIEAAKKQGIKITITGKRLTHEEVFDIATPQTIVATGYSKLSHQLLGREWDPKDVAHILRFDGIVKEASYPDDHYIIIDNKITGYGWLFIGDDHHLNVGIGGEVASLPGSFSWLNYFYQFIEVLREKYDVHINEKLVPRGWKLPLPINKKKYHVSNTINGIEFIGVGDTVGMAHPILGAGIEPGWMSSKCLAAATNEKGWIDPSKYQRLLIKNLKVTSNRRLDVFLSRMMRSSLPYNNYFAYYALKMFTTHMIQKMRENHWYEIQYHD